MLTINRTYYFGLLLSLAVLFLSCHRSAEKGLPADLVRNPNSADNPGNPDDLPLIKFETDFHDFGNIVAGEKVTYAFPFTNVGKSLLLITDVSTSCGCTIPEYPKKPIKPGEGGTIEVSFDSEGRSGIQNKTITVFSNCQPSVSTLHIKSTVMPEKAEE